MSYPSNSAVLRSGFVALTVLVTLLTLVVFRVRSLDRAAILGAAARTEAIQYLVTSDSVSTYYQRRILAQNDSMAQTLRRILTADHDVYVSNHLATRRLVRRETSHILAKIDSLTALLEPLEVR